MAELMAGNGVKYAANGGLLVWEGVINIIFAPCLVHVATYCNINAPFTAERWTSLIISLQQIVWDCRSVQGH